MIIERTWGNLFDGQARESRREDALLMDWQDCHRRAARGITESGRKIGILLPLGQSLRHGDILHEEQECRVVCRIRPTEVLVVAITDEFAAIALAAELGNLHMPLEVTATAIITLDDGPVLVILRRRRLSFHREVRVFQPLRSLVLAQIADRITGG